MDISITTPSFKQLDWLKLCIASIADQAGVSVEHIVQDPGSPGIEDFTSEQTAKHAHLKVVVEKDSGMYDAVNRGVRKASSEIVAYLNCDEQYLPGVLKYVVDYFREHPDVDVLFADMIVVNPEGKYLCHRKAILPGKYHTMVSSNLAISTCATFFRKKIVASHGLAFSSTLKDVGDAEWVLRLLASGLKMGVWRGFASTFADTGENMNLSPNALREKAEMLADAPKWAQVLRGAVIGWYRFRRMCAGIYSQTPFDYAIYTRANPAERQTFHVENPTIRWVR